MLLILELPLKDQKHHQYPKEPQQKIRVLNFCGKIEKKKKLNQKFEFKFLQV